MVFGKRKLVKYEMNVDECGSSSIMRSNTESQGFLPDDLLIMILLCLPAETLYNVMRFICKHWYNIIQSPSFISSHLQNTTMSFSIIHRFAQKKYILKPTCSGVEVKKLKLRCVNRIRASCNGLVFVLGPEFRNYQCPCYVANLVTKQHLPLPHIRDDNVDCGRLHLEYVATSKVYKVLYTGTKNLILTVGVDKGWRKVDITHQYSPCISLRGFVYYLHGSILCFDMETETFRQQISLPPQFPTKTYNYSVYNYNFERYNCGVLTMGSSLCLYNHVDKYSFEFWLMKDPETGNGQWERLPDINLIRWICVISNLFKTQKVRYIFPCGWLQSGKLLVLGVHGVYTEEFIVFYNVKTGELHKQEEFNMECEELRIDIHKCYDYVDSLIPMTNLSLAMTPGHPSKIRRSKSKLYSKENMRPEFE